MELIDDLSTDVWQKADPKDFKDFCEYTIIRPRMIKPGVFEIACKQLTEEGDIPHIMANLDGCSGKRNPLNGVRNCDLLVKDKEIVGINVVDDCVVKKNIITS